MDHISSTEHFAVSFPQHVMQLQGNEAANSQTALQKRTKMTFPKVNGVPGQLWYGFVSPQCYQSEQSMLMMVPVFVLCSASLRMKLWLVLVGLLVRIFLGTDIRE